MRGDLAESVADKMYLQAQNVDHDQAVGEAHERAAHETSGVWGALHGLSALQQIQTPWFVLITLLTILQMLRMNFFIATVHAQYEVMLGSSHLAKQINAFFDIALPVCLDVAILLGL